MQTWEQVALGAIILVIIIWRFPRMSKMLEHYKDQPKDWAGVLVPVALVVLFVVVLIQLA